MQTSADRQTEFSKALVEQHVLGAAQICHKGVERAGLHAGYAVRADLLLVREDADRGLFRGHSVKNTCKLCIRADAVVVTVGRDEAAVKADVARLAGGDDFELGGG